ncbi:hypothetical protein OESDEN_22133 [Oesophagostomum dentatum]|uniref:Peptidase M12A domain-containing protein n=1 Tax=Oesophagostomum dentatum TaxID=61180 RepID=A0A0B1S428_OESDE|nr:hypothetical protein OESDEN_22133 [Oesophagostomum dentatum]
MHYPWRSISSGNKPAILPRGDRYKFTLGSGMISFADLSMMNELYSCKAICKNITDAIVCENGGFPHPRNCSKCLCPGGYGGDNCSERPDNGCGKVLKAERWWQEENVVFKNYKRKYIDGYQKCTYWIKNYSVKLEFSAGVFQAPKGFIVEVKFHPKYFERQEDGCVSAGVEIKTNEDQTLTGYSEAGCFNDRQIYQSTIYEEKFGPVAAYLEKDKDPI